MLIIKKMVGRALTIRENVGLMNIKVGETHIVIKRIYENLA